MATTSSIISHYLYLLSYLAPSSSIDRPHSRRHHQTITSRSMATPAAASLKVAAVCMLLLCVGSDLARAARHEAVTGALLRELMAEQELAEALGLLVAQHGDVGAVCPQACQACLIMCAIQCVLTPDPATCFANCTVANACFNKTLFIVA
ncbi:hypothetical protein BS78_02G184600 [Paspalum vaginatum]|nr:hypothetical protein BS78_02G184600 [Paspalum vaginatum]